MIRVSIHELGYPGDGLYYLDESPFTGTAFYPSEDGAGVESEAEYRSGLLSGRKREWYASGSLRLEAECAWGGYHGTVREWDEEGRLTREATFAYGIKTSETCWAPTGEVESVYVPPPDTPERVAAYKAAFEQEDGLEEDEFDTDR